MLTPETLPALQRALADAGIDGWLLYDFQGNNPIANGLIALEGFVSRRVFVFVPREGAPRALGHAIEDGPWRQWPAAWPRATYSAWRELESAVAEMVRGKRVAMEYSAGDAVPYLDRVPAGVLEMVRAAGAAEVVSSGELVTRFYAAWTDEQLASHVRSAETIAAIARDASRAIREGDVLLIDLWATEPGGVYADQTWMACIGPPSELAQKVWTAVRDARDAAIRLVERASADGRVLRGADVDDAARTIIVERGFGARFTHRTGHSIDPRSLHGAGPHLDNLETREERTLVPGIGFSIEPGVYLPGELGMRSEVNAFLQPGRAIITPAEYQRELIIV